MTKVKTALSRISKAFSLYTINDDLKSISGWPLVFYFAMLITMAGLSIHWGDNFIGLMAGLTGVTCVFLVNMRKLSNFAWGFVNCALYGYVAYSSSYFGDAMLNWAFYLPAQLIGAYMWANMMNGDNVQSKKITSLNTIIVLLGLTVGVVYVYSLGLAYVGGKLATVDATTTVLSVMATFLMLKGYREQWLCWIVVNCLSIYMWYTAFASTGENMGVLVMWVMFLANSIYGTYTWFKGSKETKIENPIETTSTK